MKVAVHIVRGMLCGMVLYSPLWLHGRDDLCALAIVELSSDLLQRKHTR